MRRLGHRFELDGVRGVAILLVLAVHTTGYPVGGHVGVDLFFVLSGFLITSILLDELANTGAISLRGFYVRRSLRLLPPLVLLVSTYLIIDAAKGANGLHTVFLAALYFGNIVQAFGSHTNTLFGSGLEHLWSLAEEEQFYAIWPLALPFVARGKNPLRILLAILAVLFLYRYGLAAAGATHRRLYNGPDTHADGLIAGAAIAFWYRSGTLRIRSGLATLGLAAFVLACLVRPANQAWDVIGLPLAEAACCALVIAALTLPRWQRALSVTPLRWFGRISYSLYLWHYMLLWAFAHHHRGLAAALAIVVAYASTRWLEEPLRRRRRQRRPGVLTPAQPDAQTA
jgi:peptidoglycan/LPS O-acetylase OafA/YrhL